MRETTLGCIALALLLGVSTARATVGGPTVCDVLGWDAAAKRVYVHLQSENAGDMFGTVGYFALGGPAAATFVPVAWIPIREGSMHDPVLRRRLASLRARLTPLVRRTAHALPWKSRVVVADTLHWELGDSPRFRVRVSYEREDDFEVTTFYTPYVSRIAVLQVPGRPELLMLFSFTGDPDEGGYETQEPVLVAPGDTGTRSLGRRAVAD